MHESEVCTHCGRPYPPKLVVSGPVRQRIVDVIASRPNGIARAELVWLIYGSDPNGGPDSPNVVSVIIHHANKELRRQGYEITARPGRGALYRLTSTRPVRERRQRRQQNAFRYVI
jgi:hypothetical protein